MSVYDFSFFKNSPFSESITYTATGGTPQTIKAVVFRRGAQTASAKSDVPVEYFPVVIEIDRVDVPTVTENKDIVICKDITGNSKSYRVRKIMYSDDGCFKLGL